MPKLNEVELQNVRHLIGAHDTSYQKFTAYANDCTDPQIRDMFTQSAKDALETKQKLIGWLNPN
jgi:hypothetical protein